MAVITLPNIEVHSRAIQPQRFAFPLLFQTAILAIRWSEHHSEIVCEKGNSNGMDYGSVPVVTVKKRHVVE